MIIRDSNYMGISKNSNSVYWDQELYPDWAAIRGVYDSPTKGPGTGTEPHYHDCDEFWFFPTGRGEAWLDGQSFEITPNTAVYTPMGIVHRFQMFTDYDSVGIVTRLERQKRPDHILVEEAGPPDPTVLGFVVPGTSNNGPFADRGPRCPLSELRLITWAAGEGVDEARLHSNEHWLVLAGAIHLTVDGREVELSQSDVALLRAGAVRRIRSYEDAQAVLAREVILNR